MIYYKEDLSKVAFAFEDHLLDFGEQGYIYKYDNDKCIKKYIDGMPTIRPEIFKLYKELSLDGYSRLYDLLYKDSQLQRVGAYIMKYYLKDADNILFMPIDYTIYNLDILYRNIKILSKCRVLVRDLIPENVILGRDAITVIDYDSCVFSSKCIQEIEMVNINNLMNLFRNLYKEGFKELALNIDNNKDLLNCINYMFYNSDEPAKRLEKKFGRVKRPIDLLYERC